MDGLESKTPIVNPVVCEEEVKDGVALSRHWPSQICSFIKGGDSSFQCHRHDPWAADVLTHYFSGHYSPLCYGKF